MKLGELSVVSKSKLPLRLPETKPKFNEFRPVPKPSQTKKVKGRKPKETKAET